MFISLSVFNMKNVEDNKHFKLNVVDFYNTFILLHLVNVNIQKRTTLW